MIEDLDLDAYIGGKRPICTDGMVYGRTVFASFTFCLYHLSAYSFGFKIDFGIISL